MECVCDGEDVKIDLIESTVGDVDYRVVLCGRMAHFHSDGDEILVPLFQQNYNSAIGIVLKKALREMNYIISMLRSFHSKRQSGCRSFS